MKKLFFLTVVLFSSVVLFSLNAFAWSLIHPLDFKWTHKEKLQVIKFIKDSVKREYTEIGMGDPSTLRMMEKKELRNFKELTKVKNRKLLDNVIREYCEIGMCDYSTIYMMYKKQLEASQKKLKW